MLLSWLPRRFTAVHRTALKRRSAKPRQARIRPRLEALESRFAPAILVGPNINITKFPNSQNEAALAMNPTNPLQLFETSNDNFLAPAGLLASFSSDGGVTWTQEFLGTPTSPFPVACCDSHAVFDDFGNLFVSYISLTAGDVVLLSTDGGQTFRLVATFMTAADQPKIAVGANSVWVSFANSTGGVSAAGARVGGLGSVGAFTPPQILDGSLGGNFGEMAIGPSGQVFVEYTEDIGTTTASADNPGAPDIIVGNLNPTGVGGIFGPGRVITQTNISGFNTQVGATGNTAGIDAEPKVEFDRSGGPFNGRLYLVYNDIPSITSVSVNLFERFSDDNGATWTARKLINDNTVLDECFYPSLAIDQSTGVLAVQFYDTRNAQGQGGPTNPSGLPMHDAQLWASASFDGGVTWDKNVQVSAGTSDAWLSDDPTPGGLRHIGFGDYEHSTAFFAGVWYPVWADNSNSTGDNPNGTLHFMNIYTAKVTLVAGVVTPGPQPIVPTPSPTGSGTGTIGMVPGTPPIVDPRSANSFQPSLWASWQPGMHWSAVLTGDFNGDGMKDIAAFNQQTGQWWVGISNGTSFTTSVWASWNPNVHWSYLKAGDFAGDGKTDIIGFENGAWWVGTSTGSSFVTTLWAAWNPNVTWVDAQVGNFAGSGRADITARVLQTGEWWTGVSTGSSFSTSFWAAWNPHVTWVDVNVGDFTGSGLSAVTARVLQTGEWWTAISTGSGFATSLWASWNPYVTWVDVQVADFNGDGKADIVGRVRQTGQWWVGLSTGSGFTASLWATWNPAVNWVNVTVGDFNNSGMAGITGMVQGTGDWWTGTSTGSSFDTSLWGTWSSSVTWSDVQVGNFGQGEAIMSLADQFGQWWQGLPTVISQVVTSGTPPPSSNPISSVSPNNSSSSSSSSSTLIGSVPH